MGEQTKTYWVLKRPGLENFLQSMKRMFEIVIYTSSARECTEIILQGIGLQCYVSRVFYRNQSAISANSHIKLKDLESIDSDFKRMILIDVLKF